jgi:hypothetical protein
MSVFGICQILVDNASNFKARFIVFTAICSICTKYIFSSYAIYNSDVKEVDKK